MKTLIAMIVIFGAMRAEAVCAITEPCVCYPRGSAPAMPGTIVGHVVSIAGAKTEFAVDSAIGAVPAGASISVPRIDGDTIDSTWLLMFDAGGIWKRLPVRSDGNITCAGLSTDEARAAFAGMTCTETLEMRGIGGTCGGGGTARRGLSCTSAPLAPLLVLATVALRRRRAR